MRCYKLPFNVLFPFGSLAAVIHDAADRKLHETIKHVLGLICTAVEECGAEILQVQ